MIETSKTSIRPTSRVSRNATSSPGSVGGRKPSALLSGQQLDLFGQAHAPVNPFRWQGLEKALKTKGIYGRHSLNSSASLNLQLSLESRLRQQMDVNGSPEYALTWKRWDMQSGPPICALRASGHPISDQGYGGWQTPKLPSGGACQRNTPGGWLRKLEDQAVLLTTGWATPSSRDWKDSPEMAQEGFETSGKFRNRIDQLPRQAMFLTSGKTSTSSPVQTEKPGALNPDLPRWLMGFPVEWGSCGATAMRSIRG